MRTLQEHESGDAAAGGLAVVIPTLNAAAGLAATVASLGPAPPRLVVSDGGSSDGTVECARRAGALVVTGARGRGPQLAAGAEAALAAGADWLLFLHADTCLSAGWCEAAAGFMADRANADRAACFRFRLDDDAAAARRLERAVAWRCRVLGLPYGDQGLLIGAGFYRALGGYRPLPLMGDVDLVRRIGRRRLAVLPVDAVTSAARWRRDGYLARSARNLVCLSLYFAGVPAGRIARLYR